MVPELENGTYTVFVSAPAKIYHAKLQGRPTAEWAFTGLRGNLVFGWDSEIETPIDERERYWLRLVDFGSEDASTGRRTIWTFRIPPASHKFDYQVDRPFFHTFLGRSRMWGLLFEDDEDASEVADQVWARTSSAIQPKRRNTTDKPIKLTRNSSSKSGIKIPPRGSISKSISMSFKRRNRQPPAPSQSIKRIMISAPVPGSLVHMSHIGVSKQGVLEATEDLHPSWSSMLAIWRQHGGMQSSNNSSSVSLKPGYRGGGSLRRGMGSPLPAKWV